MTNLLCLNSFSGNSNAGASAQIARDPLISSFINCDFIVAADYYFECSTWFEIPKKIPPPIEFVVYEIPDNRSVKICKSAFKQRNKLTPKFWKSKNGYKEFYRRQAEFRKSMRAMRRCAGEKAELQGLDDLLVKVGKYVFRNKIAQMDKVIKLNEDMLLLCYQLCVAKSDSDMVLAAVCFVKNHMGHSLVYTMLTSDIVSHFKKIFKTFAFMQSEGEDETLLQSFRRILTNYQTVRHAPITKKFLKFMDYILALFVFREAGSELKYPVFKSMSKKLESVRENTSYEDLIYVCLETIVFIAERCTQAIKTGDWQAIFHSKDAYDKWYSESTEILAHAEVLASDNPLNIDEHKFKADLDRLVSEGYAIVQNSKVSLKLDKYMLNLIHIRYGKLKLIQANHITMQTAQEERMAPFGVLLDGGSSVGKSTFAKLIYYHYAKVMGKQNADHYRYVRNANDDFWSGFSSHCWCVHLDDIAAMRSRICPQGDKSIIELLQIGNQTPFCPNQAELEKKGKTPMRCELLTASTNNYHLNLNDYYTTPLAAQRRLKCVVQILPKEKYSTKGFLDSKLVESLKEGEYPDYWDIHVFTVKAQDAGRAGSVGIYDPTISFLGDDAIYKFLYWIGARFLDHKREQTQVMQSLHAVRDTTVCTKCFLPKCLCERIVSGFDNVINIENGGTFEPRQSRPQIVDRSAYPVRDQTSARTEAMSRFPVVLYSKIGNPDSFGEDSFLVNLACYDLEIVEVLPEMDPSFDYVRRLLSDLMDGKPLNVRDFEGPQVRRQIQEFLELWENKYNELLQLHGTDVYLHLCDIDFIPFNKHLQPLGLHWSYHNCVGKSENRQVFEYLKRACNINNHRRDLPCMTDIGDAYSSCVKLCRTDALALSMMLQQCYPAKDVPYENLPPAWKRFLFAVHFFVRDLTFVGFIYQCFIQLTGLDSIIYGKLVKTPEDYDSYIRAFFGRVGKRASAYFGRNSNLDLLIQILQFGLSFLIARKFIQAALNMFVTKIDEKAEEAAMQGIKHIGTVPQMAEKCAEQNVWYSSQFHLTPYDLPACVSGMQKAKDEDFIKILEGNLRFVSIKHPNGTGGSTHILGIYGNCWLVNKHMVKTRPLMIEFQRNENQGLGQPGSFILYEGHDVAAMEGTDLAMFRITCLPPVRDIRKFFCDKPLDGVFNGFYVTTNSENRINLISLKSKNINLNPNKKYSCFDTAICTYESKTDRDTRTGDCGSPLIAMTYYGPAIIGIHCAGTANKVAVSHVVTTEILSNLSAPLQPLPISDNRVSTEYHGMPLQPLHPRSAVRFAEYEGSLAVYGTIKGHQMTPKSEVCDTILRSHLESLGFVCPYGKPPLSAHEPWHNCLKDITTVKNLMPHTQLKLITKLIAQRMLSGISDKLRFETKVLDYVSAVNGYPGVKYLDAMNRHTSTGFPYSTSKKRYTYDYCDTIYQAGFMPTQSIIDECDEILDCYAKGKRYKPVFKATVKDEPLSNEKIEIKKVRVFMAAPFAWCIVGRAYILPLMRAFQLSRETCWGAPGLNCAGPEWGKLLDGLHKVKGRNYIAGDYKAFDKKMEAAVILQAYEIFYYVAEACGYSPEELQVIRGLAADNAYPVVSFKNDIIEFRGSNPSGGFATVWINNLVNFIYFLHTWEELRPRDKYTTEDFFEHVSMMYYGDDNIGNVSDEVASWYNMKTIAKSLSHIAVTYTSADKYSELTEFVTLEELSFLKRTWKFDEDVGHYLAPLEEKSIIKSMMITMRSKTVTQQYQAVCILSSAHNEYFHYGRAIFEEKSLFIRTLMEKHDLMDMWKPKMFPTWEMLVKRFMKKLVITEVEEEEESFLHALPTIQDTHTEWPPRIRMPSQEYGHFLPVDPYGNF